MPLHRFFSAIASEILLIGVPHWIWISLIELVDQCVHSVHLASAVFVPTSINLVPKELLQQRFDSMTTTSEPPTESVRPRSRSPLRKVEHCIVNWHWKSCQKGIWTWPEVGRLSDSSTLAFGLGSRWRWFCLPADPAKFYARGSISLCQHRRRFWPNGRASQDLQAAASEVWNWILVTTIFWATDSLIKLLLAPWPPEKDCGEIIFCVTCAQRIVGLARA